MVRILGNNLSNKKNIYCINSNLRDWNKYIKENFRTVKYRPK